ncbi:hypothetical protein GUJ93_ZPchr0013g35031 [Zizania palustris]|uniref:Uncharacterized protein n=1 Tax=Zizania palustris TaxID=103762 RepID=A0A8J6BY77_ZIZPA|nr:hypothetical protein GUJ93_ZPchr0013g35031 [Zizania palustris]
MGGNVGRVMTGAWMHDGHGAGLLEVTARVEKGNSMVRVRERRMTEWWKDKSGGLSGASTWLQVQVTCGRVLAYRSEQARAQVGGDFDVRAQPLRGARGWAHGRERRVQQRARRVARVASWRSAGQQPCAVCVCGERCWVQAHSRAPHAGMRDGHSQ